MTEQVKEALKELNEKGKANLYMRLLGNQDINEPDFADAALKREIFRPAELYKAASPKIRNHLIEMLDKTMPDSEKWNTLNVNGILLALAAIGDEAVVDAFIRWEKSPPAWRKNLYVGPEGYAPEGGWCIEDGVKKQLTYHICYAIQKQEGCEKGRNVYGGPAEDRCPHCGSRYVDILVLDGDDERLAFLGIKGKIRIKTCYACIPWAEVIFCKYEENGESRVLSHNGGGDLIADEDWGEKYFVLSEKPVAEYHCLEWKRSAVGGVPQYIDDAGYAVCPECGKRMKHLAQLGEEYTQYGNIYVQICTDCRIAATQYQQS